MSFIFLIQLVLKMYILSAYEIFCISGGKVNTTKINKSKKRNKRIKIKV